MLDTVLEKLGGLLPKNFIVAAFFPVFLFAGANGVMFYLTSERFRHWVADYLELDAAKQAYYAFPIVLIIAAAAYVFSMLNLSLRRVLEGELPLLPQEWKIKLTRPFLNVQRCRMDGLETRLETHRRQWWKMNRNEKKWYDSLAAAWKAGILRNGVCTYTNHSEVANKLALLEQRRAQNDLIEFDEIEDAVANLSGELSQCNVGERDGDPFDENKRRLDAAHTTLRRLIAYAINRVEDEYVEYYNRLEYNFSRYTIAPTMMGNVAESVRGYALSRYGMNLDPLWLRVQKLVQEDKDFYASLQDAKTQLDFLVSLCWLTIVFTTFWLIYLLSVRQSVWIFLVIGVVGPALAFLWYAIAVQNYLAFADVLRTAVDLYRFKMLEALHIAPPENSEQERNLWTKLSGAIAYGSRRQKILYKNPTD